MSRHTRQRQPGGWAGVAGSGGRSIATSLPLSYDSDEYPRCAACGRTSATVVDGRCYSCRHRDDARPDDLPTARAAARAADRGPRSKVAQAVLEVLRTYGPMTDDEIWSVLRETFDADLLLGSAAKRRGDLVRAGLVRDSGRTRPTRRGRDAVVWEVSP